MQNENFEVLNFEIKISTLMKREQNDKKNAFTVHELARRPFVGYFDLLSRMLPIFPERSFVTGLPFHG